MLKKSFWKYFFNTLKESKLLLLKYLVVGIYLIIVGVIANRLQLNELTYYNSMMTLCYFAEMIGFGFIEGFGIYINQNFEDEQKSKRYAKIGFYWALIFAIIFVGLLCIMPKFVIGNILGLDFKVSYAFYYIMVAGIFLNAILNYILDLLKKVQLFKFQMICSIIQAVLIVGGLLLLVISSNLVLILISIIYLITYLVCIIVGLILLIKNNVYSINLLKFEKIGLSKTETKVILSRTFSEVIWEVGYMFIALFILKSDVIAYNQYCYFENALDILSGIFFAFANITAIKICRCIGSGKKDGAYTYALNSLKATFVLWAIYAIIAFVCFIPLKQGLNVELKGSALISTILYVLLTLLRFVDWNLGSYILGQSEIFAKASLIMEIVATLFWIIMYLLAPVLSLNIFAIYTVIAFEALCKIVVQLIVLIKKKWLNKLDENV